MPYLLEYEYFYFVLALILGLGALFYARRQAQGYYRDYKATVSLTNLTGKTAIITGGNSGVGLGSAIHLARLNAKVIIACRNSAKATSAVKYIQQQSGNDNVYSMSLNLSSIKSVEAFAAQINKKDDIDIDYLVLNAGIAGDVDYSVLKTGLAGARTSSISNDGLDQLFQTNYLGHWYLTNLLLDRIKSTADKRWKVGANEYGDYGPPVRIVSVSSVFHKGSDLPLDNDEKWNKLIKSECTYGQSKLLQIVHMKQLQTVLHEYNQSIQCMSVTPGMVWTNIIPAHVKYPLYYGLYPLVWYLWRDIMCGSQVVLHVITNDKTINGGYYSNCRLEATKGANDCSNDCGVWSKAWQRTDDLVKSLQNNTFH